LFQNHRPKNLIRTNYIAEELEDVAQQFEEFDGIPWWQELKKRMQ
jgi:hypothetical protein